MFGLLNLHLTILQDYDVDVAESLTTGHVITTVFARSPDPDYSGNHGNQ